MFSVVYLYDTVCSQTCIPGGRTNCTCVGTIPTTRQQVALDITQLFTYPLTLYGTDASGYKYVYSPCTSIPCGLTSSTQANVCQESTRPPLNQFNAGASPTWSIINSTCFTITYSATTEGKTRTTIVTFIRDPGVSKAAVGIAIETNAKYYFTITMPIEIAGESDISGYVGFILFILVIVACIAYFVVGAIIMYTFKGARGIEVIPNIGFWKDLPFLIKDGVLFAFRPCLSRSRGYTKM
ncbi:hypothetical protein EMCRGX_G008412 [Ephydatia muelleri]